MTALFRYVLLAAAKLMTESFRIMLSLSKDHTSALGCNALCIRQFGITATFYAISNHDDAFDYRFALASCLEGAVTRVCPE